RAPPVHRLVRRWQPRPVGRRRNAATACRGRACGWRRCGPRQIAVDGTQDRSDNLARGSAQEARLVAIAPPIKLVIAGAGGRMGQTLLQAVITEPDLALAGALDVPASPILGRDAGERS